MAIEHQDLSSQYSNYPLQHFTAFAKSSYWEASVTSKHTKEFCNFFVKTSHILIVAA